jgi:HlyD family secretion protein
MQIIKKYFVVLIIGILVGVSTYFIYKKLTPPKIPPDLILGTGRIDGDLININTKYAGRIKKLFVDEGDFVKKGQIIAVLSSKEYEAQLQGIKAQIDARNKEIQAKEIQLKISEESLPQNIKKAQFSLESNKAMLKEIEENINSMEKVVKQDEKDYKRYKNLAEKDLFPYEKFEKIKLKYETDKNQLNALEEKRKQVLAAINTAQSTLIQAKATLKNIEVLKSSILGLKDSLEALKSNYQQIKIIIDEMKIKSPINGYIVDKIANEGEVIGAGMSVVTAIDPDNLYLEMFVDTLENGKIKIGDKGEIFLDAYPDNPIPAVVVYIAQKAEFTPKDVAVREDRIQRVFAVHLKPIKLNPLLKLGIPAVGVISIDGKNLPKSLSELPEI